jgi:hypothetical protein
MEILRSLQHLPEQAGRPGSGAYREFGLQTVGAHPIRGLLVSVLVLVSLGATASVSLGHGGGGPVSANAQQTASAQVLAIHAGSTQSSTIDGSRLPWMYAATRKNVLL